MSPAPARRRKRSVAGWRKNSVTRRETTGPWPCSFKPKAKSHCYRSMLEYTKTFWKRPIDEFWKKQTNRNKISEFCSGNRIVLKRLLLDRYDCVPRDFKVFSFFLHPRTSYRIIIIYRNKKWYVLVISSKSLVTQFNPRLVYF